MSMRACTCAPQGISCSQQLDAFRQGYYQCLTLRADTLFELTDALLCAPGKVTDLAHLSLEPEHHRGYGALYDAVNHGRIDLDALKSQLGAVPVPKVSGPDGRKRIVLAVDVSNWLRPDAACSRRTGVLPQLRQKRASTDGSGVAVFLRGRAGIRCHLLDRAAGRGAAAPWR